QAQRDHLAAARQAALARVEMKRPELIRALDWSAGHLGSLRKISEIRQRSQRTPRTARFYPPGCADRNREEGVTMPKLLPDQTFYASPTMAMQAPAETLAYVALLNPDLTAHDALAVLHLNPPSPATPAPLA